MKAKELARMEDAINRLAKFIPNGELLAATDPPAFLHNIADYIEKLEKEYEK